MFNTENKRLKKLKLRIEKSGLFDDIFYLRTYSDIRLADIKPLDHYVKFGIKEDRKPNKDFDPIWYREYYSDVKENEIDSFSHYVLFGRSENRFQNIEEYKERNKRFFKFIDEESYLLANIDIEDAINKNLIKSTEEHFTYFGYDEVKLGKRRLGIEFPFFNEQEYLDKNIDIKTLIENDTSVSAFDHFLEYGSKEFLSLDRVIGGYYPLYLTEELKIKIEKIFDEESYLEVNQDLKEVIENKVYKNALEHFFKYGIDEVRSGKRRIHKECPLITESLYLLTNPDILKAYKQKEINSPFEHFLLDGLEEILAGSRIIKE